MLGSAKNGFFNDSSSQFFKQTLLPAVGNTDSEKFEQLNFTFALELADEAGQSFFKLSFGILIKEFVSSEEPDKIVKVGIHANGETCFLIDFEVLPPWESFELVILFQEQVMPCNGPHSEFVLLWFNILIDDVDFLSLRVVNIEIFLPEIGVNWVHVEEVLGFVLHWEPHPVR